MSIGSPWGLVQLCRDMTRHDRTELPNMCDEQPLLFPMYRTICVWGSVRLGPDLRLVPSQSMQVLERVSHMQC